jgi:streptogramin lyase
LWLAAGAAGVCVLALPGAATAAELPVPGQYATIQAAINAASDGDVVIVADGTYAGAGNKNLDFLGKAITVRSANGANVCTIDCEENGRAFHFWRGEGPGSVVRGFKIERAAAVGGGAILCNASGPTIVDCWLTGNRALEGSNTGGGALACVNGSAPMVSNCLMVGNHALGGFGVQSCGGGAIYCDASSSPVITSCTMAQNSAYLAGGAIYCGGGRPILTHCTITGNKTRQWKAGALHFSSASPTIMNCQIDANDASEPYMGGGISCTGEGTLILSNCTIADNDPAEGSDAGGLSCYGDAYAEVTNCIFWGNTPVQIYSESGETTVTYSDIQGGWSGQGNLNADPLFIVRDQPGDPFYGKYYLSQTATGDPNQLTDSPCVNAGDGTAQQTTLWGYTTRTDLVGDDFDTAVDLGFHYPRDCDDNGIPDSIDLAQGTHEDCNLNGIPDPCDILIQYGGSCDPAVAVCSEDKLPLSTQGDGVPDECYWRPTGRTFTDNADFDDGTLINVHHDTPTANELRRCRHARPLPFLWVPDQAHGTVNRIYTANDPTIGYRGEVLGEFLTAPNNASSSPSRTAVDLDGNLWVTNRNDDNPLDGTGSAVKLGLTIGGTRCDSLGRPDGEGDYIKPPFKYNTCIDRNGDGLLLTSRGPAEVLPWGAPAFGSVATALDETISLYVRVDAANARHVCVDRDNNVWIGGPGQQTQGATVFELRDGETGQYKAGLHPSWTPSGGYGGFIDCEGVIWSTDRRGNQSEYGHLLKYDTKYTLTTSDDDWYVFTGSSAPDSYGVGIDRDGDIWCSQYGWDKVHEFVVPGYQVNAYATQGGTWDKGVAVTYTDNHVWIANSSGQWVSRLNENGTVQAVIDLGQDGRGPSALAVDQDAFVWASCTSSGTIKCINPSNNQVVQTVQLGGSGSPYNYGNMTGDVTLHTSALGTWNVVHDGGKFGAEWHLVMWNRDCDPDPLITVEARAADRWTALTSQEYIPMQDGKRCNSLKGRCIEVRVRIPGSCPAPPAEPFWTAVLCDLNVSHGIGDMNCSGTTGFDDINPFVTAQSNPNEYKTQFPRCGILLGDINGDGLTDFGDINPFVALLIELLGADVSIEL